MLRYIGIVWNSNVPSDSETAQSIGQRLVRLHDPFTLLTDKPGLSVLFHPSSSPADTAVNLLGRGAVLGTIFARNDSAIATRRISLTNTEIQKISDTAVRSVLKDYWGSYVLLLQDPRGTMTRIVRAPMGHLQCFHTALNGVHIFFSCLEDILALRLLKFSINWDSIRAQVVGGDFLNTETGLSEISTLNCGECIESTGSDLRRVTYWSPSEVSKESRTLSYSTACSALRSTVRSCVRSWAALHESILLELSGGFDSSVVLSCLATMTAPPVITPLNYYSRGSGDERAYARSMATRYGLRLVEVERDPIVDLRRFLSCARTVRPVLNFNACFSEPIKLSLSAEKGATAVFTGELGDEVFGRMMTHDVVREHAIRTGLGIEVLRCILDCAQLTKTSVWSTLARSLRSSIQRTSGIQWSVHSHSCIKPEARLASQEALIDYEREIARFIHPWLREVEGIPPGMFRLLYALALITSPSFDTPFSGPETSLLFSPLASQPLVELALAIPSHFHIRGGHERALARTAFADDLSDLVHQRGAGKGTPDLVIRDAIDENRSFLREVLLDGVLVNCGYLDRSKVETLLSGGITKTPFYSWEILQQLYIETWLRRWNENSVRVA